MTLHPLLVGLLPEVLSCLAATLALLAGLSRRPGVRDSVPTISLIGLGAALAAAGWVELLPATAAPSLLHDGLLFYVRLVVYALGVLFVLVNRHVPSDEVRGEYFAMLLYALAGVSLVSAADDLVLLFLALELVSVPTYVLIGLSRTHDAGQEATVKYFFLGAFASAITLYGFSFLYGVGGVTAMTVPDESGRCLARALATAAPGDNLVRLALVLSLAGLAFKIAAVPLHFYIADVYQGAAAPVAGVLGFVPKIAGFVALVRLFSLLNWQFEAALFWLLWALAAATMTVGNTLALMQRENVKRVLAYSSVAHSGYMLVALLAGPGGGQPWRVDAPLRSGLAALLFYIVVYGIMNLGAFAALAYFRSRRTQQPVETFDELAEAARAHPAAAISLAVCAIGLMGMPPTAGLLGKAYLFTAALSLPANAAHKTAMIVLVVIGAANAAIAAAYYLRIVAAVALGERRLDVPTPTPCHALRVGVYASAALAVLVFIRPGPLTNLAKRSAAAVGARNVRVADGLRAAAPLRTAAVPAQSEAPARAGHAGEVP